MTLYNVFLKMMRFITNKNVVIIIEHDGIKIIK